jgi:hypothetical protein
MSALLNKSQIKQITAKDQPQISYVYQIIHSYRNIYKT